MHVAVLLAFFICTGNRRRFSTERVEGGTLQREHQTALRVLAALLRARIPIAAPAFVATSGWSSCTLLRPNARGQKKLVISMSADQEIPEEQVTQNAENLLTSVFLGSDDRLLLDADEEWKREVASRVQRKKRRKIKSRQMTNLLQRIVLPTLGASLFAFFYYDEISLYLRSQLDADTLQVLYFDQLQWNENYEEFTTLLFAIFAGTAYEALYEQQEDIYLALYQEVSEARSLLEQIVLVCQNRPFYNQALSCLRDYVKNDLRRLDVKPDVLLSSRPMEDPLESIMYMTSVGVPSIVYKTVRSLRQARGKRLAALQRKFPTLSIFLLYVLAVIVLFPFPYLSSATANQEGVLQLQCFLFACLTGCTFLVLSIITQLWRNSVGIFNIEDVLQQLVFGLEEELEMRSRHALSINLISATPEENSGSEPKKGKENSYKLPRKVRVFFGRLDRAIMEAILVSSS